MHTRQADAGGRWRYAPLVLILCLGAASVFAQVPDATIQRIAEINVQLTQDRYLRNAHEIDDHTWKLRKDALDAELRTLTRELRQSSPDEQQKAISQIDGLTKTRLATLEPQWRARANQLRQQHAHHDTQVTGAIRADGRAVLDLQRRRLLLQQRRDRGEITAEDYSAEDKKALDAIMALRAKYVSEGQGAVSLFDSQLAFLTKTAAKNPAPRQRTPKAQAAQGGTTVADYQRDVGTLAGLEARRNDLRQRCFVKKEMSVKALGKIDLVLAAQMSSLIRKWTAAGRGPDIERDWRQRLAAATAVPVAPAPARQNAEPASPVKVYAWLTCAGVIALFVGGICLIYVLARRRRRAEAPLSTVYGTAEYAPTQLSVLDDNCLANGIFFGKSSAPELVRLPPDIPGAPMCSTPEHHTLIVARTRTGKGTRVIVPTLLRYAGSALVIDPKGENAAITSRIRRVRLGQSIHILNPWNELAAAYEGEGLGQATYNPLDILVRTDPNAVAIAQSLAAAICPAPASAKDRFWQGSAANILTGVFLWLADQPGEQKTLARARQIVSLTRKEFTAKYLTLMAVSDAYDGAIREMAAPLIDLADETYSGIMSNLSESTKFLSDPQIKAATATSSFSMEDLAARKTTVYVVVPTERMDTQATWLRLVIAAAMHVFKHPKARRPFDHRCLFLIDEFAALGRLDDLPRDIATMSGFGVDFALIVQGLDQLKDHYGEARGTILSNCAYQWYCNVNDLDSAKYLSDTLGKATVGTTSTSDSTSTSSSGQGGSSSESHTTSHSETGRALLNPDEILNLGREVAICLQPQGHPHYLRPIDYWGLDRAFAYLREEHPGLYWEPSLAFDENPYFRAAPPPPPPPPPGGPGGGSGGEEKARNDPPPQQRRERMTEEEAREILGVAPGASPGEIRAAYLRLMQKVHPDHGGSSHFSKELNAAKAVLLRE